MPECIHGLELSRCDLCSPKVAPKGVPASRAATGTSATRASARVAAGSSRTAIASKRPINVADQRIHHVTHLSNLEGILNSGGLFADAYDAWSARPAVDVSSRDNRNLRRSTAVAGTATVADYVPFYLSPDAHLWEVIRAGATDPRLTSAAVALPASEFVIFVSTVGKVAALPDRAAADIVVSDRDAADPRAHFAASSDDYARMLRRLSADRDSGAALSAEFLVKDTVPLSAFSLVGVANDKARARVRTILQSFQFQPRIAVHPPWFAVPTSA